MRRARVELAPTTRSGSPEANPHADQSWAAGGAYPLTTPPNLTGRAHDRRAPGVNHLAFKAGGAERVDAIMVDAQTQGWRPLYAERYPQRVVPATTQDGWRTLPASTL